MRRFPRLATLLESTIGFLIGTTKLSVLLVPILLNSCRNVQPEETPSPAGEEATPTEAREQPVAEAPTSAEESDASEPIPTDPDLEKTTAQEDLTGVEPTAAPADTGDTTGPPTPISATTRRSARGLPSEVRGYPSWARLQDLQGGPVPAGTDQECWTYINLPSRVDSESGTPLELPFEPLTTIVIESKRATDNFIREVHTLRRTEEGWEVRCFVRGQAAEGFHGDATGDDHPAEAACRKLVTAIQSGEARLVLGE